MKQTINFSAFCDAFHAMDRYDQFGYNALESIFDYLEELDEDYELDVIAICCEYSVDSWEDIAENNSIDLDECEDDDEKRDAVLEYLNENTSVINDDCKGMIVYVQF